ncbi:MAG: hypothetical protein IJU23_13095 [Proteobacteria bacterium]|nr:hypothetical protein [Pseudomonadota bacterium]
MTEKRKYPIVGTDSFQKLMSECLIWQDLEELRADAIIGLYKVTIH